MQAILPQAVSKAGGVLQKSLAVTTRLFGDLGLTWILCLFLLLEAQVFRDKFTLAFGRGHPMMIAARSISSDVRAYVVAKTFTSLLTGIFLGSFLKICGVDFAILWGLIAIPLNFIPTIGAIIAMLPAVGLTPFSM